MSDATQSGSPLTAPFSLGDGLTIDEIIERYADQWVIIRVTEKDEDTWPTKGHVLVSAPNPNDAVALYIQLRAEQRIPPGYHIYSFHASPMIRAPSPEYDAFLEELSAELFRPPVGRP